MSEQKPQTRLRRPLITNIRGKIILPYLILTFGVAVIGIYVVTNLVSGSLDERLNNQLLEAGRVVSDSLARREIDHLEQARLVAYTQGLDEALSERNQAQVVELAQPLAGSFGLECLIILDAEGGELLHVLRQADGSYQSVAGQSDLAWLPLVQPLLEAGDPEGLPRRGLALHPANQHRYYLTAVPAGLGDQMVGVVVIGVSFDTLLPYFKSTSLADVILYSEGGQAIATTFAFQEQPDRVAQLLADLSVSPEVYQSILNTPSFTDIEEASILDREYRLARGPLRVGNDTLGAFAIVLPSSFIVEARSLSRNSYAALFLGAIAAVILMGYFISFLITRPINRLVQTSRAVAEGNLDQRTGIDSPDEIGTLATTFDEMTARLKERSLALEELLQVHQEMASRLQAILASIGDGVLLEDVKGQFTALNTAANTLLEDMAANFLMGPLREVSLAELAQSQNLNPWLLESRRLQLGSKVVTAHSAAVQSAGGDTLGKVIVLRDVTAEVEAEQLKDAFVAHTSHELRTPLTAIKGYSELLLATGGDSLSDYQRSFLRLISQNTDALVEMINGLLDFSEMESKGRLGLQRRPILLSTPIEEIATEWQPRMEEKGLSFRVEMTEGLPRVEADLRRLHWAIVNLVRNAWQYTPPQGRVTLRLYSRNGQVVLDVIDTGVGISHKDQERLFSRFYRGTIKSDEVRGLGLGLYVAKAIIEAHGGRISFLSKEGEGSTFSVMLPAVPMGKADRGASDGPRAIS